VRRRAAAEVQAERRQQRYKLTILEIQGSREGSRARRQQRYKVIEGSSGAAVRSL
jgi:hypothetical protein